MQRVRYLAVAALVMLAVACFGLWWWRTVVIYSLRISAGSQYGHRHELAEHLVRECDEFGVTVKLSPSSGSVEALHMLELGELEMALVQGGLPRPSGNILQVAVLVPEPLHLVVRPGLETGGLESLAGKRVNLSTLGSGTRLLSSQVLDYADLTENKYEDCSFSYSELQAMPAEELPDAIFFVSSLPSQIGDYLISEQGYVLKEIPFGEALLLRDRSLQPAVIPAYTYRVEPPEPATDIRTVAPRLTLVARRDVADEAVAGVLAAIYDGDFHLRAELPEFPLDDISRYHEWPLHPGTSQFLLRHQPLITNELVDNIESARSFVFSALLAAFLAWRWYRRRQAVRFERYFDEVSSTETKAFTMLKSGTFSEAVQNELLDELTQIKERAIEAYSSGRVRGEEQLTGFINHVADARQTVRTLHTSDSDT
ncbi:hypothetical protein V22_38730 [Calycomorphotria hydatis]|uniref:NMT1/THI5 like protein n=1 Tax=Calycomorphotria hydatis TaxID=2528027 RepID=A0A517TE02_9PLAN|nr:hypothetical protein V22_38730 [Calycomorphotria hydatis]